MSSTEALRLIAAFGFLLIVLRPMAGLIIDIFKVMVMLSLTGLILHVLPFDQIDEWSRQITGAARITSVYVPVLALLSLIALTTINIQFLKGKSIEGYLRLVIYIIGGVASVGSREWIAWERSVGDVVVGTVGMITNLLAIIQAVLTP